MTSAPVAYLVETPKERLSTLEKSLVGLPWQRGAAGRRGEAVGRGRRPLPARPEPGAHQQGARHAEAAEVVVGATSEAGAHGPLSREPADEARRRRLSKPA